MAMDDHYYTHYRECCSFWVDEAEVERGRDAGKEGELERVRKIEREEERRNANQVLLVLSSAGDGHEAHILRQLQISPP